MSRTPFWKIYENDVREGITFSNKGKVRYGFVIFSKNTIKILTNIEFDVL